MATHLVVCDRGQSYTDLARGLFGLTEDDDRSSFVLLMPANDVDSDAPDIDARWNGARQAASDAYSVLTSIGIDVLEALPCDPLPLRGIQAELRRAAYSYRTIVICSEEQSSPHQRPSSIDQQIEEKFGLPVRNIVTYR